MTSLCKFGGDRKDANRTVISYAALRHMKLIHVIIFSQCLPQILIDFRGNIILGILGEICSHTVLTS